MMSVPVVPTTTDLPGAVLMDCLPIGVCVVRPDWTVMYWNRCLEEWSRVPRSRIVNRSLLDIFPRLAQTEYEKTIQKIFDGTNAEPFVVEQNGHVFFTEGEPSQERFQRVQVTAIPSNALGEEYAMITVEDVTNWFLQVKLYQELQERAKQELSDRQMAESALDRLGRFHELILQSAGNGIVGLDRDGNTLFANPAAARMLDRDMEDLVGECMHSILGHDCTKDTETYGPGCLLSGPPQEGVCQLLTEDWFHKKDGTRFPVEYLSTPMVEDGEIVGAVVTFSDISTRRFLEQEVMRYTMKLEEEVARRTSRVRELEQRRMEVEKLAALAQVAAGVAHEINNPLAGIKNAFHLIKKAIPPSHPRIEYVGKIEHEIDRISGIIKRMYQLYQPDPAVWRSVNLKEILHDVWLMVEPMVAHHHVELKMQVPPGLPLMRLAVRDVTQVFCNLVQNAIQASSANQVIQLAVEWDEHSIRVAIADQAGGIPDDILPHIFEPFFTTKSGNGQGGMGLGLSVSRSLIEALGGRIDVHVTTHVGTTFTVHLPVEQEADAEPLNIKCINQEDAHGSGSENPACR